MKLYELSASLSELIGAYNEAETEEQSEAILQRLNSIDLDFTDKLQQCAFVVSEYDTDAEAVAKEISRLQQRKTAIERQRDGVKAYMKNCLETSGLPQPKVKTPLVSIWVQNNPLSVAVSESVKAEDLPLVYQRFIPARVEIDKTTLIAAAKAGEELPPGIAIQQGTHLRIK